MVFLDNLTPAAAVCMALALLCAVLLAVLLAIVLRGRRAASEALSAVEETLRRELQATEGALGQQSDQRREELLRAIGQLGENLSGTFSAMSRSQAEQVNALVRQSYDNAQAFDLRQQGMQRIADESLKRIETRMQGSEAALARALSQNETRMEALRVTLEEGARLMREENAQKLNEMRQTVDEKLSATLEKRLTASFSQVSERLEQVYRSLGEVHSLASGVGDLKRMLGNVKTRGVWGEIQLGALLEEALTDTQYQRNVAVSPGSSERVEFAVCLPGREEGGAPVYLPIDSKFPQEDYARLAEAAQNGDQPAVEAARKALMTAVRTEARRIGKYIAPPHTTDFAVMFLPLEGLYAEVMQHASAVEAIQREQRVLIAGPSTLLALLNSLQMGFRTLAIERRSAEVWKLLGVVKADFGSFATVLKKTQEKLQQATDSIDSAFVKTRAIEKRLRRVEVVEVAQDGQLTDGEEEP